MKCPIWKLPGLTGGNPSRSTDASNQSCVQPQVAVIEQDISARANITIDLDPRIKASTGAAGRSRSWIMLSRMTTMMAQPYLAKKTSQSSTTHGVVQLSPSLALKTSKKYDLNCLALKP